MTTPLLAVEDLNVSFPGRSGITRAVRNASFTLGRERLGIVGESGSGKSTTGRDCWVSFHIQEPSAPGPCASAATIF